MRYDKFAEADKIAESIYFELSMCNMIGFIIKFETLSSPRKHSYSSMITSYKFSLIEEALLQ